MNQIIKEKNQLNSILLEITSQHNELSVNYLKLKAMNNTSDEKTLTAVYQSQRDRTKLNNVTYQLQNTMNNKYSEMETKNKIHILKLNKIIDEKETKLKAITRNWKKTQQDCVTWKHKYKHLEYKSKSYESSSNVIMEGKIKIEQKINSINKKLIHEKIDKDVTKYKLQKIKNNLSKNIIEKETLHYKLDETQLLLKGREEEHMHTINILKGTIHVLQKQLKEKKNINFNILREEENIRNQSIVLKNKLNLMTDELKMTKRDLFEIKTKYARVTGNSSIGGKAQKAKEVVQQTKHLEAMLLKRRMERLQNRNGGKKKMKTYSTKTNKELSSSSPSSENNALGGMKKDKLQLNKALSIAAERLHEIIVLKNHLENVTKEKKKLELLLNKFSNNINELQENKNIQLSMANRALRAESMAAWLERQLLALNSNIKIDYSYHPELTISEHLNKVLQEENWLVAGDNIASNVSEKDLASLANM